MNASVLAKYSPSSTIIIIYHGRSCERWRLVSGIMQKDRDLPPNTKRQNHASQIQEYRPVMYVTYNLIFRTTPLLKGQSSYRGLQ